MPLPEATLSLGPLISPGGTEPVKPKVAMLVRLSSATIDALTSVMNEKEKVYVDLGSTPGIHIDGTFYSMRMQKEETPHEIYLRVPRSNSLKLYANVSEKLFIEPNEIGDNLKDKIHKKTVEAAKQRDNRRTKYIEAPSIQPVKVAKKKKESASMFHNAARLSDQAKVNISTLSARVPSPALRPSTKSSSKAASSSSDLFNRLIRCMAVKHRTRDMIVKLVSGDNPSLRRDIIELMDEVGEPTSPFKKGEDAGSKIWCLKAESWLHVRPMEWPNLSTQERLYLSRTGRMKLATLGYSEKDPEWGPFAYRSADNNVAPEKTTFSMSSGDARQREKPDLAANSGISSSEVKKPKTKPDRNAETPIKDESLKATSRVNSTTKEVAGSVSTAKKVPGSGFKAGKSGAQNSSSVVEASSRRSEKEPKLPRHSLPMVPSQTTQTDKTTNGATTAQRVKKGRESDPGFGSESERDMSVRLKSAVKHEGHGVEMPTLKRRQGFPDSYDSDASASLPASQKKRKTETGAIAVSSFSQDVRSRDLSLPKKPDLAPPPHQKPRKEPISPSSGASLPKINKKANNSSRLNTTGNVSKNPLPESTTSAYSRESHGRSEGKVGGKRRRGSPIYTSSEDEGEISKIRRIIKASSPAAETNGYTQFRRREHEREPRPLPTDHASLRMRYTATYGQCMAALTTLLAQKSRIDLMLRHVDTGSVTDSDGEGELMDVEDLKKLSGDYERMHEELETIRQKFAEPVQ
ncbi:hypothetical protein E4T56_gene16199 [Termitomyces sp. T112]|nr:hypothetical protein E4T56_gene16199 [Termitomyces sp. T112]